MMRKGLFTAAAMALLGLVQPTSASAGLLYDVSIAAPQIGAPWSLYFQLIDGSGFGDANNTVVLTDFFLGKNSAGGNPALEGGAEGSLTTKVVLTDSSFFNSFSDTVSGGGLFSFRLNLTSLLDPGDTPDTFAFSLFNDAGFIEGSDDISGALLIATLAGEKTSFQTFGGLTIQPVVEEPVPEPGTLALLVLGLSGAAARKRLWWARPIP